MNTNYVVITYVIYLCLAVPLTVWVGHTLFRHGRLFLVDSFHGNTELADAVNRLLLVGFYLINVGYVALALKFAAAATDIQGTIEAVAIKVGMIMVVLGVMHLGNLWIFTRLRRRSLKRDLPPALPLPMVNR